MSQSRVLPSAALAAAFVAAACSSKPAAQVGMPAPTPTPTIVRLEPTPEPSAPVRVAQESLPVNVDEINRRGYLKDSFFAYDRYELTSADRDALTADAAWLRKNPSVKAKVEGHCDERGTGAYNMALGERRAEAAKDYLGTLGVDPSRLATVSYGKERPFATGHDEDSWAQNRRAHFVVTAR